MIKINDKMVVLLVSPVPPPSGGDSTWSKKYIQYYQEKKYPLFHINTSMIGKRSLSTSDSFSLFDEVKRSFNIWKNIKKTIASERIDICHFNCNCSPRGMLRDYISIKNVKKKKIKIVLHCRCNVKDQVTKSRFGINIFKKIAKKVDLIFVQNTSSFQFVNSIVKTNTIVMPNCIEEEMVLSSRTIEKEIKNVLFVGHVRKTKGIDEIIEVAKSFPNYSFRIAGPITDDYSFNSFSAYSNVIILGDCSSNDITKELDSADVFLFPSYTEGFSNAVLEAMSRGLPILTTNVGANEDMIENKGGYVVNARNVSELIEKMNAISDYSKRVSMSQWNINKVKKSYVMQIIFEKIRDKYRELLNESAS